MVMKKILTIGLFVLMFWVSFGQYDTWNYYDTDDYENVELIDQALQDIWLDFTSLFFGFITSVEEIFAENHTLYLADYCTLNDNIFEEPLYCGEYNDIALILDNVLENIFSDDEWQVDMDVDMAAELDLAEMKQIMQDISLLRKWPEQLSTMLKQYMEQQPNMTDEKTFMFKYILFNLDSMFNIFSYLEWFYRDIMELMEEGEPTLIE